MGNRSMLTGQEKFITFQIDTETTLHGAGLIWNILRRYYPEDIAGQIMGMRIFASMKGAAFDVPEDKADNFAEIYNHAKESASRELDFTI